MRVAYAALALSACLAAVPAGAVSTQDILIPDGRIPLASRGNVTAVAVGAKSVYVAEEDGNRICEYTFAGNLRRCLDQLPSDLVERTTLVQLVEDARGERTPTAPGALGSIACSRRLATANAWPASGSTSPATPIPTATSRTSTVPSGPGAIG